MFLIIARRPFLYHTLRPLFGGCNDAARNLESTFRNRLSGREPTAMTGVCCCLSDRAAVKSKCGPTLSYGCHPSAGVHWLNGYALSVVTPREALTCLNLAAQS